MRRPRRKLEVDTFPFLAVLLCAMGAFILLLMVIDRRAKIVSQNKARESHLARKQTLEAERLAAVSAMKAKHEQSEAEYRLHKEAIHAELEAERADLSRQMTELLAALARVDDAVARENESAVDGARKISVEAAALDAIRKELQSRQGELDQTRQAKESHRQLRERLTVELATLEMALRNVRERQAKQRPVYSLVPYKGKHGASAKPLYIEVSDAGVAIHPGPTRLAIHEMTPDALRAAVALRTGPLVEEKIRPGALPSEDRKTPYLLFLVRPGGILPYYQALDAFRGYAIDFGYELIEADWAFDFESDKLDQQPWRNVARVDVEPANVVRPPPKGLALIAPSGGRPGFGGDRLPGAIPAPPGGSPAGLGPPGTGNSPQVTVARPVGSPGGGSFGNASMISGSPGGGPPGLGPPGQGTSGGPAMTARNPSLTPFGNSTEIGDPQQVPKGTVPTGPSDLGGPGGGGPNPPGTLPAALLPSIPTNQGGVANGGARTGAPNGGSPTIGSPTIAAPAIAAPAIGAPGTGVPGTSSPGVGVPSSGVPANGVSIGPGGGVPAAPPGTINGGPPNAAGSNTPGSNVPSPGGSPAAIPGVGSLNSPGGNGPQPPGNPTAGNPSGTDSAPGGEPLAFRNLGGQPRPGAQPANSEPGDDGPTLGASPFLKDDRPATPPPRRPALGRIIGNRDFVMTVECFENTVSLTPPGRTFDLSDPAAVEKLCDLVKTLVAGRQRTVRPGEPPYRPIVVFRVQPDGRRAYYSVYPRLAEFGFPMTRDSAD